MQDTSSQPVRHPVPLSRRLLGFAQRLSWPAGTVVAVALALLLTWHVINGRHGLQVWQQKRAEDRQLQKEIEDLRQENARLRDYVQKLKSDPNAIEQAARNGLHYARPTDIVWTDPAQPATQPPPLPATK
jgi:cell division protein FtsB